MKKNDIVKGGVYASGGKIRKVRVVVDIGDYPLYSSQEDRDCVKYEILHDGFDRPQKSGRFGVSTRTAFAYWAKERVGFIEQES